MSKYIFVTNIFEYSNIRIYSSHSGPVLSSFQQRAVSVDSELCDQRGLFEAGKDCNLSINLAHWIQVRILFFLRSSSFVAFAPRQLNLKNDNLRKKFDGIKYDLKKVEEVVYDLSIRGLNKPVLKQVEGGEEGAEKVEGVAEKVST